MYLTFVYVSQNVQEMRIACIKKNKEGGEGLSALHQLTKETKKQQLQDQLTYKTYQQITLQTSELRISDKTFTE